MTQNRGPLPRLNIPPSLNLQQPIAFDRGQSMFSPALPTSLQHSFHPPFPLSNPMQTPMQPYFTPTPPGAPGRPTHRAGQASVAQLAAIGIHPPQSAFPMTPSGGHFPRPSLSMGTGGHPFPNRNRRQLSIGGPPKAILGGPARKLSPLPTPSAVPTPSAAPPKGKKIVVNLPKESTLGEDGAPPERPPWARTPLAASLIGPEDGVLPVEPTTAQTYPPDGLRDRLPDTIDVFLPGKRAWDTIKQRAIEEKLEKLGVERGAGSNIPHIHAPHARAASISSPADPALLLFKLNKLHQSQQSSAGNSLSTSPQPPFGLSPSPHHQPPRFLNRHGHSMSLAQPPSYQPSLFVPTVPGLNPFGPTAVLGSDMINQRPSPGASPGLISAPFDGIHAPQGRVPVTVDNLAPPLSAVRPDSRPDFIRGFGLDTQEEEEEEEEEDEEVAVKYPGRPEAGAETSFITDADVDEEEERDEVQDGMLTASQSRHHSRHVSRLSAALSLRSVGGVSGDLNAGTNVQPEQNLDEDGDRTQDMDLEEAVGEWTGSDDAYNGAETTDDDESIGDWSNPSDEERARRQRVERRMRRRDAQLADEQQPRRLPNFPRPPETSLSLSRNQDDIISNPSEEEHLGQVDYLVVDPDDYYSRPPSNVLSPRPLPPLPHSRGTSGQLTIHDPANAHSREPSGGNFVFPAPHAQQPSAGTLNPFAKPFVFGTRPTSDSWGQTNHGGTPTPPKAPFIGHARLPSFGKPLNAAAQEFKPSGFTFRPPPGVPQMPVPIPAPAPETSRPLPVPPAISEDSNNSSPFKVQGREKRQRRGSVGSVEEGDSMASFRFPANIDSPRSIRLAGSPRRPGHNSLNTSAEPFTFAGFSAAATLPFVPSESLPAPLLPSLMPGSPEETLNDESTAKAENSEARVEEFVLPSTSKVKRAPIPLDFKHPVSSATVPAGLFKALVNGGDERTRRSVRSRLSSRDEHGRRPSLDDLNVPPISRKISRTRLVTDPGSANRQMSPTEDVFRSTRHARRRSSLPDALRDATDSSISEVSMPAMDLTSRLEMHQYEERLEALLDEKLSELRQDIARAEVQSLNPSTEARINEVISLFRTQLQDSARRGLDDSQMDARGELDFELLKDVILQGHSEARALLKREMSDLAQRLFQTRSSGDSSVDLTPVIEDSNTRTIQAVVEAISELSIRLESIGRGAPARERDALVDQLMSVLTPAFASFRPEAVDYDYLTDKLTQAVKPHISQLIDLASDKRETAGLIVDRILPLLHTDQSATSSIDTDAITLQLITEVRRAIAPIDAFEIKEQVADLVVERLDSRLAVRDKTFNVETVTSKVADAVAGLLEPMQQVMPSLTTLKDGQQSLASQQSDLSSAHERVLQLLGELNSVVESLHAARADLASQPNNLVVQASEPDENVLHIKSVVEDLVDGQKTLGRHTGDLLSLHTDVLERLNTLPDAFAAATSVLQGVHAEFALGRDSTKRELEELRKSNTDFQIQVAKARGAHGQVRVEKDVLSEKLTIVENDRERLKNQLKEAQAAASSKATESSAIEARNSELEEALAKALARLQASDVTIQSNQERITELEKVNREVTSERQALKSKVDSLDLQVTFTTRDKDTAVQALVALQKQHDHLSSQQSHWDELHHASEQIEMLTRLIGQADNEELKELRQSRDRSKVLEGEHAALQKRFKEMETRAGTNEKAAATARQTLSQAQQRSSEWERRCKELEGQLEMTQTKLDQEEQTHAQLDADYSLVKLQLEEQEANDRLAKDQENQLRTQIKSLEADKERLQNELERAKTVKAPAVVAPAAYRRPTTNGSMHAPQRPASRASTIYADDSHSRSVTPNGQNARSSSPARPSVWDSMHAPKSANNGVNAYSHVGSPHTPISNNRYPPLGPSTPKGRQPLYPPRASRAMSVAPPSPTPSVVSLAPTQGDDGWWQ